MVKSVLLNNFYKLTDVAKITELLASRELLLDSEYISARLVTNTYPVSYKFEKKLTTYGKYVNIVQNEVGAMRVGKRDRSVNVTDNHYRQGNSIRLFSPGLSNSKP